MKNYWFYLESYSFIFEGIQGLIIYNTLNGKIVNDANDNDVKNLIKQLMLTGNGYCIALTDKQLEHPAIHSFIEEIRNTFSGDIIDTALSNGKPFVFKPILNLLNDPEKTKDEKGYTLREDVLECVHEVSLYFNNTCKHSCKYCHNYFKQFLFCTSLSNETTLNIAEYQELFNHFAAIGLKKVNLLGGNLLNSKIFHDVLNLLKEYNFKIEIYAHISQITEELSSLLSDSKNLSLVILADKDIKEEDIKSAISCFSHISYTWCFVISSIQEYTILSNYIDCYNLEGKMIPFFSGDNQDFFAENVYLDLDDILLSPINKQQIFARQVMNENLFGKLTIMPNGDVYANVNKEVLGNLKTNSLNELVYKEISQKDSWFFKREIEPCGNCIYKFLCPSPSNYELAMGKMNLCNIL